eukprot:TRINITY_DN2680_c1_g2_i2.p1 TRINITY_DN2680_c1_g2~~TRINITY_DN2680_c1_g2_i2.p1  ORF type:complete len:4227 (+),score=735.02 TRINITY_DN2680_c1_g2_i2:117-12797(+)
MRSFGVAAVVALAVGFERVARAGGSGTGSCSAPLAPSPFHDVSACNGIQQCSSCTVTCQGGSIGEPSVLRCLASDDALRSADPIDFVSENCSSPGSSGSPGASPALYGESWCGVSACCPAAPLTEATCKNKYDDQIPGQCAKLLGMGYVCEEHFCPSCGAMAGHCDKSCGYGPCSKCGDCWRQAKDGPNSAAQCDDGNLIDGDGCSSNCLVEPGYTCRHVPGAAPDVCETCHDTIGWRDAQGYSCEDYALFRACDMSSFPTDPLAIGGRMLHTPDYHMYAFAFDLAVTPTQPLKLSIKVKAAQDAHIFLGRPGQYGFEIVIGGWNNGLSVIRKYPGRQEVSHQYGPRLDGSKYKQFWLRYDHNGFLAVGTGDSFTDDVFLGNDARSIIAHSNMGWSGGAGPTALDWLSVATGWGAMGSWDLRLTSGTNALSFADLARDGNDATTACCVCGGGLYSRTCSAYDNTTLGTATPPPRKPLLGSHGSRRLSSERLPWALPSEPRTTTTTTTSLELHGAPLDEVVRRLQDPVTTVTRTTTTTTPRPAPNFASDGLMMLGFPNVDGFLLQIRLTGCTAYPRWINVYPDSRIKVMSEKSVEASVLALKNHMEVIRGWKEPGESGDWIALVDEPGYIKEYAKTVQIMKLIQPADCKLNAIVVPELASSRVSLPLENVWPQVRRTDCRLRGDGWASHAGAQSRWQASDCHLAGGAKYSVVVHLEHYLTNVTRSIDFELPPVPSHKARSLELADTDTRAQRVGGSFKLLSAVDESAILQYRVYWASREGTKVVNELAMAVVINTYANGGFRNGFFNECLFNDCEWKLALSQSSRRRGVFRIQHEKTGECFCFRGKALVGIPCPAEVLTLDAAIPDGQDGHLLADRSADHPADCLWELRDHQFNGSVESRLRNLRYSMCLCQVPTPIELGADGRSLPAPLGAKARELEIGRWCGDTSFGFVVNGKPVETTGYCEWTSRPESPIASSSVSLDAVDNQSQPLLSDPPASTFLAETPAWLAAPSSSEAGVLNLSTPRRVPAGHTFAAWVNVAGIPVGSVEDPAVLTVFGGSRGAGAAESCLELRQRARTDTRVPACAPSASPGGFLGEELDGSNWALGLQSCGSQASWDSGFDVQATAGAYGGWVLLASTGTGADDGTGETTFYASEPQKPKYFTYSGNFGCATPGCTATAYVFDVPRDRLQTCSLEVDVYITDYGRGITEPNPQVVESINISGSTPTISRNVRQNCHPAGVNQPDELFTCVRGHGVDDLVAGPEATRAVRVDVRISAHVAAYARHGQLLSGIATIRCRRLALLDKHVPPSGGLRRVGYASRTCAGSTLETIGTSSGATTVSNTTDGKGPEAYIAQAWVWERSLSEEDLQALFFATRTRYYPYYDVSVTNKRVIEDNFMWNNISDRMYARYVRGGGLAKKTFLGLPRDRTSTCLLTVAVAMTDFSDSNEVVEYITLDGMEVVTNCWPGRDDAWEERFNCVEEMDISQTILKNNYMADGEVEVEIKISPFVDSFTTRENWHLDARVDFVCAQGLPPQVGDSPYGSVSVEAGTNELVVVAASDQGEGPGLAVPFVDGVNGFSKPPFATDVARESFIDFSADIVDEDGAIWLFSTERRKSHDVGVEDILNGLPGKDNCVQSHRRRGPDNIWRWKTDRRLSNCVFEPFVPYRLFVYVDRANPPYGGGSLAYVDFEGPPPYVKEGQIVVKPQSRPSSLQFIDEDPELGVISGVVTIGRAYFEDDITEYRFYFGRGDKKRSPFTILGTITASGKDFYNFTLPSTPIQEGLTQLVAYSKNDHGEYNIGMPVGIVDLTSLFNGPPSVTEAPRNKWYPNDLYYYVTLNTLPGNIKVDIAMVKKGQEYKAQPRNDYKMLAFDKWHFHDVACSRQEVPSDTPVTTVTLGPCINVRVGEEYALVVYTVVRTECPCFAPCYCKGDMLSIVTSAPGDPIVTTASTVYNYKVLGSSQSMTGGRFFVPPDVDGPSITIDCNGCTAYGQEQNCRSPCFWHKGSCRDAVPCSYDTKLVAQVQLRDPGNAYPAMVLCAACRPPTNLPHREEPMSCVRSGDTDGHQYWRVRIPAGRGHVNCTAAGGDSVRISEVELYTISDSAADGMRLPPGMGTAFYGGGTPVSIFAQAAFDGNAGTSYPMKTLEDTWVGLYFDEGPVAILRARVVWSSPVCTASEVYLEHSDNDVDWTILGHAVCPGVYGDDHYGCGLVEDRLYHDLSLRADVMDWYSGLLFPTAWTDEAIRGVPVEGLTPGSDYSLYCYAKDALGNGILKKQVSYVPVKTTDTRGPTTTIKKVATGDYTAELTLEIADPGGGYPAITQCFARELIPGKPQALPDVRQMGVFNQRCHHIMAPAAPDANGRVSYMKIFNARTPYIEEPHIFVQNTWGEGGRKDMGSCGTRYEAFGRGGCFSTGKSQQKMEVQLMITALEDAYVFLGEEGPGLGYEVLFGGWGNSRVSLRRGYASDIGNINLQQGGIAADYQHATNDLLDLKIWRHFWISVDPVAGTVRVGFGESFKGMILIDYKDPYPVRKLEAVYIGAGHYSGHALGGIYGATFFICPRINNVALGKMATSSSVAFEGTADKAVDGKVGDNTFCEYCQVMDPRHVCAGTRRGGIYTPPYIRVTLGQYFDVYGVRLVVPMDGMPEQRHLQVFVGKDGARSENLCREIEDAGGDNFYACTEIVRGAGAAVYGLPAVLAHLPDAFGIRVCEFEVYIHVYPSAEFQKNTPRHERELFTAAPDEEDPYGEAIIKIPGLWPQTHYEAFCYAEDTSGNGVMSHTVQMRTYDRTPPSLLINVKNTTQRELHVALTLLDPGDNYPAVAKCAAAHNGYTPQEQDTFFEHRHWRMRFVNEDDFELHEKCEGKVTLDKFELRAHDGYPLYGTYGYSSDALVIPDDTKGYPQIFPLSVTMSKDGFVSVDRETKTSWSEMITQNGGSVFGDLVVTLNWDSGEDVYMRIIPPGTDWVLSIYDNTTMSGGTIDVSCRISCGPIRMESVSFVLAEPGSYTIEAYRGPTAGAPGPDQDYKEVPLKLYTRVCGVEAPLQEFLFFNDVHNLTLIDVQVPKMGCNRVNRGNSTWKAWQSTVLTPIWPSTTPAPPDGIEPEPWPQPPSIHLRDMDLSTCTETGGLGRATPDRASWWRLDLGEVLRIDGLWLAGNLLGGKFPGTAAAAVDVYVVEPNASLVGLGLEGVKYNRSEWIPSLDQGGMVLGDGSRLENLQIKGMYIAGGVFTEAHGFFAQLTERTSLKLDGNGTTAYYFACTTYDFTLYCNTLDVFADDNGKLRIAVTTALFLPNYFDVLTPETDLETLMPTMVELPIVKDAKEVGIGIREIAYVLFSEESSDATCALGVPVSDVNDIGLDAGHSGNVLRMTKCTSQVLGSQLLFVASPRGSALSLCEVEVVTQPLWVATHVALQFGEPNVTDLAEGEVIRCGAQNVMVEYSDDGKNWIQSWLLPLDSESTGLQAGNMSWWDRMFLLPFQTSFEKAGTQDVVIPMLRENVSYDIFCWARDANGNKIEQELVSLPLPWADTHRLALTDAGLATKHGKRRLAAAASLARTRSAWCTEEMRALLPCEGSVVVGDKTPPSVLVSELGSLRQESQGDPHAPWTALWVAQLEDASCEDRYYGLACWWRCVALDRDVVPASWDPFGDGVAGCASQNFERWGESPIPCAVARWSARGSIVPLALKGLPGGYKYEIVCEASDPWNNTRRFGGFLETPGPPTAMPTEAPVVVPTHRPTGYKLPSTRRPTAKPTVPPSPPPTPTYDKLFKDWTHEEKVRTTTTTTVYRRFGEGQPSPTLSPVPEWTWPTKDRATPSPTTSTTPPYVLPKDAIVPTEVQLRLTLGVASAEAAQKLQRPSALQAMALALREPLGLSSDDELEILGVQAVRKVSRRRLADASDGSENEEWELRLSFAVRMVGQAHAQSVHHKLKGLNSGSDGVREAVATSMQTELKKHGYEEVLPTILKSSVDEDMIAPAPAPKPKDLWGGLPSAVSSGDGASTSSGGGGSTASADGRSLMMVIGVAVLGFTICAIPIGVICFYCFLNRRQEKAEKPSGKVASSNNLPEPAYRPSPTSPLRHSIATSGDWETLVTCKVAWEEPEQEKDDGTLQSRAVTPLSLCSTATGDTSARATTAGSGPRAAADTTATQDRLYALQECGGAGAQGALSDAGSDAGRSRGDRVGAAAATPPAHGGLPVAAPAPRRPAPRRSAPLVVPTPASSDARAPAPRPSQPRHQR